MAAPRVSIVITCHNLGAFLPETLASIDAQTFRDVEICVVDDGSTDPATLEALEALPSRIALVRSDNKGLPAARNLGARHTEGEFICAVDADDVLAPTLLERSLERLDAEPGLAFVSHWLRAFGDESWEWRPDRCDFPTLLDINTVNGAALVRRAAFEAVGGWDESMRDGGEDWEFWIRLVKQGLPGAIIPEVLFHYRRRADSMSRTKFAGDGHARLYRTLVEKHTGLYAGHLAMLAAQREADSAACRKACDELDEQLELQLAPDLARVRDDVADAQRQRAASVERAALDARARQVEVLESAVERLRAEARAVQDELTSLTAAHARAAQEVTALRRSWSWRVTSPLRMVGAWAMALGGRGRRQ
ncbi:MAG: glycosyltransferase [Vicinamibacterales bacterium]